MSNPGNGNEWDNSDANGTNPNYVPDPPIAINNDVENEFAQISAPQRAIGSSFPEGAYKAAGGYDRVEPLLTADVLKQRFFFGIPLVSPLTKEKVSVEDMQDYIKRACGQFEMDAQTTVAPVQKRRRLPFDPNLYQANIWCEVEDKPIQKVIRLAICSASYYETDQAGQQYPSGAEIYRIPNQWIDVSYGNRGRIFVNPINPAFSAIGTSSALSASGASILQFIGQQGWVPAYWTIEFTTGFCSEDGNVPIIVNECVGQKSAMLLLDNLIPLFRITSHSLSIDAMSQSVSDQLYQLLMAKRKQLEEDYTRSIGRIKVMLGNKLFVGNV